MLAGTAQLLPGQSVVSLEPLRIYTGIAGQIGDIVMFTATTRRLKELFPNSTLTFAVSDKYREAGELIEGLPYVDRLFVTELYFEKLTDAVYNAWHLGWPVDLRGEDETEEQRGYELVFDTRPRHRRMPWWHYEHQVAECAHMIGVPGPINLRTEIAIPPQAVAPIDSHGKIALHNDPNIDATKAWPWENVAELVRRLGDREVVLLGQPGPDVPGTCDLRGKTTLAQAAAVIRDCACYVGIDSGLMWVAGSLQAPAVGLYGTSYIAAYEAIHPHNPRATYLQVEGAVSLLSVEAVQAAVHDRLAPRGLG